MLIFFYLLNQSDHSWGIPWFGKNQLSSPPSSSHPVGLRFITFSKQRPAHSITIPISQSNDCLCWTLISPQIRCLLMYSVGTSAAESLQLAFANTLSLCVGVGPNPVYQCTIAIPWLQRRENPSWPKNLGSTGSQAASALLPCRGLAPMPPVHHWKVVPAWWCQPKHQHALISRAFSKRLA